jgi:choline dehydrogenase-like flavoprotein
MKTAAGALLMDSFALVTAMIFEVDPSLANPDDFKKDPGQASAARQKYNREGSGPLTILPCSICYLPLSHFVSPEILSSISSSSLLANRSEDYSSKITRESILRGRFDPEANLGQVEYIFDLGNWSQAFHPADSAKKYGTMLQILQYPFSRGSIHIRPLTSASDTSDTSSHPNIDPQYYGGTHGSFDLELMVYCQRFAQKICSTRPLANIIRAQAFPSPSESGGGDEDQPLRDWIVANTTTDWHPVGTCAMGGHNGPASGVVDARLRVYGVEHLRVVDASIMPLQISAHLQATVYAIAEKAAHMILEDLVE